VAIKLEHYEKTGGTVARLEWQSANMERQVVPTERLQPSAGALYPTTFAAWVASGRVNANNPVGDSDGDGDLDLLEYALGGSAASGVQVSDALRLDTQTNSDVMASIVYPSGLSDVQFALEGSSDLRTWSDEAIIPQVTNLGDGTERRSWMNPVRSIVRLRVNHSSGAVEFSAPMTLQRLALHSGTQTLGIAALRAPVFAGIIEQVTGNALFLRDNASLAQAINTDARYYVEIRDGSYAGHRIDVQSVANGSVTLDTAAEHNTLFTLPVGLVGARLVVRPHVTLGSAFNPDQWAGAVSASAAEQVLSFRNGVYTSYWLMNGGPDPMRRSWLKVGSASLVSMNDTIILPGAGLMVKVPTGARSFAITGQVRTNAFVQPLIAGLNFITSPWPVDASPASLGMNLPGAFTASNRLTGADQIQIWKGELSGGTQGYQTYWLLDNQAGIRRWITTSDATLAPLDNVLLMPASRSFFFKAQPATAAQTWTMNPPAL
jgi:uncharacterized protein (TIGR02597 family)